MKITKIEFNQARSEKFALEPAIKALMAINPDSLNYGSAESSELQAAIHFLAARLELAEGVIAAAELQIQTQDKELINGARDLKRRIPDMIESSHNRIDRLKIEHATKAAELLDAGFTQEEIERMYPFKDTGEVAEIEARIDALKIEEQKLDEFLSDGFVFDESILEGMDIRAIRDPHYKAREWHEAKEAEKQAALAAQQQAEKQAVKNGLRY